MEVSREQVLHIAKLSALNLTEDEIVSHGSHLSSILNYMDKLGTVDTTGVTASEHAMPVPLKMRKDIVETKFSRDAILSNAPKVEDGFFVVPKVVG